MFVVSLLYIVTRYYKMASAFEKEIDRWFASKGKNYTLQVSLCKARTQFKKDTNRKKVRGKYFNKKYNKLRNKNKKLSFDLERELSFIGDDDSIESMMPVQEKKKSYVIDNEFEEKLKEVIRKLLEK